MSETLRITDLHVSVEGKPILNGINLEIGRGEVHAAHGPERFGQDHFGPGDHGPSRVPSDQRPGRVGRVEPAGDGAGSSVPRAGIFLAFQRPVACPVSGCATSFGTPQRTSVAQGAKKVTT